MRHKTHIQNIKTFTNKTSDFCSGKVVVLVSAQVVLSLIIPNQVAHKPLILIIVQSHESKKLIIITTLSKKHILPSEVSYCFQNVKITNQKFLLNTGCINIVPNLDILDVSLPYPNQYIKALLIFY